MQDFRRGKDGSLTACIKGPMVRVPLMAPVLGLGIALPPAHMPKHATAMQAMDGWDMERQRKQHCIGRKYVPRKLVPTQDECMIQKALKDRGASGGCWTLILRGRLPRQDASEEGFRTMAAYAPRNI